MRRPILLSAMTVMVMTVPLATRAEDRYGPSPAADAGSPEPLATLTWPGKTPPRNAVAPITPVAAEQPPARRTQPASIYEAAPSPWPRVAATSAASAQPAPKSNPRGVSEGLPPHFYSVARQYGVQPDPVQLSPQFLASTPQADMAEPPPLPASHIAGPQTANMSTAAATNQLRQAQEASADADSAALGN